MSVPFADLFGDELDALHNSVDDLVLNARVFSLRVLPDGDQIDVIVQSLVALDGLAGADVGVQAELLAKGKVEGPVKKLTQK